jgi:hypothetical protein
VRLGQFVVAVFDGLGAESFDFRFGGDAAFLEYLFHVAIGGGRLELACARADGLLDCRIGGGEDQRPRAVRLGAIVAWVRQGHGQDVPLCVEGLVEEPCLIFTGGHGLPVLSVGEVPFEFVFFEGHSRSPFGQTGSFR